jgi:predicted helicase
MPAPFVIAHMEVASLLETAGVPLTGDSRAGVFLTNALTGWVPVQHPQAVMYPEMEQEREASENIKQHGTILVILGNPPYNGYPGIAKIEEERDLSLAYGAHIEGLPAPQGHGRNDLYVRFFRIAERRIAQNTNGQGIVCFISNNAWLDGLSHPTMRYHYLHTFPQLFIDNLNGDRFRTGKTTPEGLPDPSVFSTPVNPEGIQPGTAIATLVRTQSSPSTTIHFRNLWGAGKLTQLESESQHRAEPFYDVLQPFFALGLPFAERIHSSAYTSWPRLPEMFPQYYPGVQTKRDALLIDIDKQTLESRLQSYFDPNLSTEAIREHLPYAMKETARFEPVKTRNELLERGFKPWQIVPHLYRPFDLRWLYWEPTTRLLGEKSPDYVQHHVGRLQFFAQQKPRIDYSPPQIARAYASLDLIDRGASCFPLETVERTDILLDTWAIKPNVSETAYR